MDFLSAKSLLSAGRSREGPRKQLTESDLKSLRPEEIVEKYEEFHGNKSPMVFRFGRERVSLGSASNLWRQRNIKKI